MTELTKQLVIKISPELDELIDSAFAKNVEETGTKTTRSDYIRDILKERCAEQLRQQTISLYVKDTILNNVIWAMFSKKSLSEIDNGKPFRALRIESFQSNIRNQVEEIFLLLETKQAIVLNKSYKDTLIVTSFDWEKLKTIALSNIHMSDGMIDFIKGIKQWNTKNAHSIPSLCFTSFCQTNAILDLSDIGLVHIERSISYLSDLFKYLFVNSPSDYSRILFDIPLNKRETKKEFHITYPSIYILEKGDAQWK